MDQRLAGPVSLLLHLAFLKTEHVTVCFMSQAEDRFISKPDLCICYLNLLHVQNYYSSRH